MVTFLSFDFNHFLLQESGANYHLTSMEKTGYYCIVPVSLQQPPEDPHPLDPELLLVGPGVGCSLPFTEATVTTLPPGLIVSPHTGPETQLGEKRAHFYNEWGS